MRLTRTFFGWWMWSALLAPVAGCIAEENGRFTESALWGDTGSQCPSPEDAFATLDGPNVISVVRLVESDRLPRMCCYTGYQGCIGASFADAFGVDVESEAKSARDAEDFCFIIDAAHSECPAREALPSRSYDGSACSAPDAGPFEHQSRTMCTYLVEMDW